MCKSYLYLHLLQYSLQHSMPLERGHYYYGAFILNHTWIFAMNAYPETYWLSILATILAQAYYSLVVRSFIYLESLD